MDLYDETTDPRHQLRNFKSSMYLANDFDATRCKAFPAILTKVAMKWFDNLPPRLITCFDDLARNFLTRFSIQQDKTKYAPSLLGIKQEAGETLRDYMERFNKECLDIQSLPTEVVIMGLINGLKEKPFSQSISNEKLVREGQLDRYLPNRSDDQKKRRRDEEEERQEHPSQTPKRHVHMISGGFAGRAISKSSRKKHLKEVCQVGEGTKLHDLPTISFTKEDAEGVTPAHDNIVMITMILANDNLHRILVDQGNSVDILFKSVFDKLGLEEKNIKDYADNLFSLGDTPIWCLWYIPLYTTFRKGTRSKTQSIDYIVVDVNSAYNALIGQTTLIRLAAVVSTPHLCMKFPTVEGIATIKGDQRLA
ncbi:uncharacterized protein [Arachis hypogaea]|uniref:uncharacterized protein n=1 Tax=Arachis hypogaea TaxID=3818 RepID=UPI003B20C3E9